MCTKCFVQNGVGEILFYIIYTYIAGIIHGSLIDIFRLDRVDYKLYIRNFM